MFPHQHHIIQSNTLYLQIDLERLRAYTVDLQTYRNDIHKKMQLSLHNSRKCQWQQNNTTFHPTRTSSFCNVPLKQVHPTIPRIFLLQRRSLRLGFVPAMGTSNFLVITAGWCSFGIQKATKHSWNDRPEGWREVPWIDPFRSPGEEVGGR